MRSLKVLFAALFMAVISMSIVGCSDNDTVKPGVVVTPGTTTKTSLSFTVNATNATKCAWVCVKSGEAMPSAEQILANEENIVSAEEPTLVEVDGLLTDTEYIVVAAASDDVVSVLSAPVTIKTSEKEVIAMENVNAVLSGGWGATREASLRMTHGNDLLEIAVLYDSKAKYMPAGTYTVSNDESAGTVDNSNSDYTYFYYNGELLTISAGTLNVEINDNDEYVLTFDFTTERGDFQTTYTGKIEGIEFFYSLSDMSEGRRVKVDGEVAGEYCIKLTNAPLRTVELTLDFFADASSTELPEGTYSFGTSKAAGTFGPASQIDITTPSKLTESFAAGTVVVSKSGKVYIFEMKLANADGYEYIGTFTGEISGMVRGGDDPEGVTVIEFNRCKKGVCNAANQACFYLISPDNEFLNIDAYTDSTTEFLPAGTYTVGEGTAPWTITQSNQSSFEHKVNGTYKKEKFENGSTMTVTVENGITTIVMDFTVESGKYRAKYSGEFLSEDD